MNTQTHIQIDKPQQPLLNAMGLEIDNDDRHIDIKEVVEITGVSKTSIWRMVNNFQFPFSHGFTPSSKRWWLSEVNHWMRLGSEAYFKLYGSQYKALDEKLKAS